jgi:dihydropteroate synthase
MGLARSSANTAGTAQQPPPDTLTALFKLGRPLVMGILNVTPDSFSDGGQFLDSATAIAHAGAMAQQGADILDIGSESTRPYGGAQPVSADDELARLKPVLPAAVKLGLPVSIDTIKASIAAWALDQGAASVNDVWGLQRDPDMAPLVAERGVPVIVMHNREAADPAIDIVADVIAFFSRSRNRRARHHRENSCSIPASASARRLNKASFALRGWPNSNASGCRCWSAPRASASSMR